MDHAGDLLGLRGGISHADAGFSAASVGALCSMGDVTRGDDGIVNNLASAMGFSTMVLFSR